MFDFDPPDCDDARDPRDRDGRNRNDDALTLGRGPSAPRVDDHHDERRDRDDDRRHTLDHADHRDRDDVRWADREIVYDARDREYTLRGSQSRTLATVGAFRVVPARELRDHADRPADPRADDLRTG